MSPAPTRNVPTDGGNNNNENKQKESSSPLHRQRKNTEIVAPVVRRELTDLKDYLLSTVVTTSPEADNINHRNPSQQKSKFKLPNNQSNQNNNQGDLSRLQLHQQQYLGDQQSASTYDLENSRFCYPVRPIPRRNQQQLQQQQQQQQQYYQQQLQQQTIGVVIPTTPNSTTTTTSNLRKQQLYQYADQFREQDEGEQQQHQRATSQVELTDLTLGQRLQLLQQFWHLTNNINNPTAAQLAEAIGASGDATPRPTNIAEIVASNKRKQQQQDLNMVHEINVSDSQETVVNSTSLEDVALSESSGRAQSIQSLHSILDTPTPEATPSYDELQQRLDASNRNIQNMQEQQQQLLRLQQAAKQHLSEMENLRQHSAKLSFASGATEQATANGGTAAAGHAPQYETIEQVHNDMAALAGRMKNLTAFIHNQNELSDILGDDGPEIMAEQEALQQKLESLRVQRDEMRNLVDELQDINRHAEKTVTDVRNREHSESTEATPTREISQPATSGNGTANERIVPVEYSRIVPIELLTTPANQRNGLQAVNASGGDDDSTVDPETAALIRQKAADVEAMKGQLQRLKDMMQTVNLIESHTERADPKLGRTSREATRPTPLPAEEPTEQDENAFIARKVQMLNEVTTDLRSQAEYLQVERERIKALKEEIIRRKEQAAAAAQLGDDALKRHSGTPTRSQLQQQQHLTEDLQVSDSAQLKADYEAKKREFERLCRSLQGTEETHDNSAATSKLVSEADDECEEERKYATLRKQMRSGSNSKTSVEANNTSQEVAAALEATSIQSDSSRYSMPPAMPPVSASSHWAQQTALPNAWHSQYFYGGAGPPSSSPLIMNAARPFTPPQPQPPAVPSASTAAAVNSAANTLGGPSSSASTTAALPGADSLMQQFAQTQQMIINSICQCNQMLWHQQHEIANLKHLIHLLQGRLLTYNIPTGDLTFNLRSESVPPPLSGPTLANNFYLANARAQSEQPLLQFQPRDFINYAPIYQQQQQQNQRQQQSVLHQQQQHYQQQQHHGLTSAFNYSSETQQQNASSTNTNHIYTTLNNATTSAAAAAAAAVQQQQQQQQPHYNNEAPPQSPLSAAGAGPGPIFMHHHNNAIHQNNANLRTQNHYANNLQQQQQHSNTGGGNTLNNQVPPGNRANNYWDNFRSYSRQNLLSNKSNEEQQQQSQQQDVYHTAVTAATATAQQQPLNIVTSTSATGNFEAVAPLPQQQQQQHHSRALKIVSNNCNNLNMDSNICAVNGTSNISANKYMRSNHMQQQHQEQQPYRQHSILPYNNLYHSNNWPSNGNDGDSTLYGLRQQQQQHYNIVDNQDVMPPGAGATAAAYSSQRRQHNAAMVETPDNISNLRNMNVNMGNSPHYQRNKLPTKQTYRTQQQLDEFPGGGSGMGQRQRLSSRNPQQRFNSEMLPPTLLYNRRPNRERDFVLRAMIADEDVEEDDDEEVTAPYYNIDYNMPPHLIERGCGGLAANYDDDEDNCILEQRSARDDEDDTTSDEIKRNLLVNALKNDKFTTKFYESIKEDVFRRLESMLLETEGIKDDGQEQQQQLYNDVGSNGSAAAAATAAVTLQHDPLRKYYLNARMNRQQLRRAPLEQFQLDEEPEENSSGNNNMLDANTESNQTLAVATAPLMENENPEDEANANDDEATAVVGATTRTPITIAVDEILEIPATNMLNWRKNVSESVRKLTEAGRTASTRNNNNSGSSGHNIRSVGVGATKRKPQRSSGQEPDQDTHTLYAEEAGAAAATTTAIAADYELIRHVLQCIHNELPLQMEINDARLVEIAKMTATAAQNSAQATAAATLPSTLLSPKKIYAQMKRICFPRQRDEFINCYCNFLESLFYDAPPAIAKQRAMAATAAMPLAAITTAGNLQINCTDRTCSPYTKACTSNNGGMLMVAAEQQQKTTSEEKAVLAASEDNGLAAAAAGTAVDIVGNEDEMLLIDAVMHVEQEVENNENPEKESNKPPICQDEEEEEEEELILKRNEVA